MYIPQGHAHHLESRNNKFAAKPWNEIPGIRYVEPVRVVGVNYAISQDGKDETVATLRLRLADPAAASHGEVVHSFAHARTTFMSCLIKCIYVFCFFFKKHAFYPQ